MSECIKRLTILAQEIESDDLEDYGLVKHKYGSILSDLIILTWQDLESPYKWVQSDPILKAEFEKIFKCNAKNIANIKLYRGSDYMEHLNLKKGDIVDYSERYTSWSTDINVAMRFTNQEVFILFIYEGSMMTFDLNRTNPNEKEHILGPTRFIINNIIPVPTAEDPKFQQQLVKLALENVEVAYKGPGKLVFLEVF